MNTKLLNKIAQGQVALTSQPEGHPMNPKNPQAASEGLRERIKSLIDEYGRECRADGYAHVNDTIRTREAWAKLMEAIDALSAPTIAPGGDAWVLTMRSGVASQNDNVVGTFSDYATALWVGGVMYEADKMDHPEYRTFDVKPVSLPAAGDAGAVDDSAIKRAVEAWYAHDPEGPDSDRAMRRAIAALTPAGNGGPDLPGCLPTGIPDASAYPPNYAGGWNDCLRIVYDSLGFGDLPLNVAALAPAVDKVDCYVPTSSHGGMNKVIGEAAGTWVAFTDYDQLRQQLAASLAEREQAIREANAARDRAGIWYE